MKEKLEKYEYLFDKETVDFIAENEDPKMTKRLYMSAMTEALDANGSGNVKKTFVALASMVSQFFLMCYKNTKGDDKPSCEEQAEIFTEVLNVFCKVNDMEEYIKNTNDTK